MPWGNPMVEDDYLYFRRRAETELDRARKGGDHHAARVHGQLAQAYIERAAALATNAPVARTG